MPRISAFYGIIIRMYWDERDHPIAHFHAEYAGKYASIAFDGTLLAGSLPTRALRLIQDWAPLHQDELLPTGSTPATTGRWRRSTTP